MASFRKAVIAAILKSLLRGKSLIQAILAYWVSPLVFDETKKGRAIAGQAFSRTIQDFLKEAETDLLGPISGDGLNDLSVGLKKQFLERLQSDLECMLPSYNHQLPTGQESGQFLALDVGGSTLRVALVELSGRSQDGQGESRIVSMRNFKIDKVIKDLEGTLFFDWMAARISETLSSDQREKAANPDEPLPIALAWSFPIEQTSLGAGKLQGMGKGFMANKGLFGQDLGEIVNQACKKAGLHVTVEAIINDSSACLLSQAYTHPSTRFGLILGTGLNIGAYLPVTLIGTRKFGTRPAGWFDRASHVIVNTELGMFGRKILPVTRWDQQLLDSHRRPDFQPLEHMVSGMYLGEVARFALIEAIETTGIFGGIIPPSITGQYSLGTDTLSMIESDDSAELSLAKKIFAERHPSPHSPSTSDLLALRSLASFISVRSSALVAACVYTLWDIRLEGHKTFIASLPESSDARQTAEADLTLGTTKVAFNGSVIENYPGYLSSCQRYVDHLVEGKGYEEYGNIELVPAKESSIIGAAVASACAKRDE